MSVSLKNPNPEPTAPLQRACGAKCPPLPWRPPFQQGGFTIGNPVYLRRAGPVPTLARGSGPTTVGPGPRSCGRGSPAKIIPPFLRPESLAVECLGAPGGRCRLASRERFPMKAPLRAVLPAPARRSRQNSN